MPTRKVGEVPEVVKSYCRDPEHEPPNFQVFENGVWEHQCPSCGHITRFTVTRPSW